MAALPAYVSASSLLVAYWRPDYSGRAWCQVELLMAFAFMTTGRFVFRLDSGFANGYQAGVKRSEVVVPDPQAGHLTNPDDRAIIGQLSECAQRSCTFTYCRVLRNLGATSPCAGLYYNLLCCCQCCFLLPWASVRKVRPGRSRVHLLAPVAGATTSVGLSVKELSLRPPPKTAADSGATELLPTGRGHFDTEVDVGPLDGADAV